MPIVFNQHRNEILVYDDIGWEVTAKQIVNELKDFDGEEITVRINSPGGSVYDGIAIYNALKSYEGEVNIKIDGVALSMASGIAMAGDHVEMAKNALLMIHDPSAMAAGSAEEMERAASMLKATKSALAQAYADKTGMDAAAIGDLMRAETWYTADEAKEAGFIDSIGGELKIAASFTLPTDLRIPAAFVGPLNAIVTNSSKRQKPEKHDMATDTKKDAGPQPATLEELLSLKGSDNDFAIEQLKSKATLSDAQNALNAILLERLEAANEAKADAETKLSEASKKPEPKPGQSGHDPVKNDSSTDDQPDDPKEEFDALMANYKSKGLSALAAYARIDKEHPGLLAQVRNAANRNPDGGNQPLIK